MANEYQGYSGEQRRFQQYGPKPRVAAPDIPQGLIKRRQFLDKAYNLTGDPYGSWKLKRSSIRRDLRSKLPDITDDELEWAYEQYNLGDNTNPGDFSRAKDFGGTVSRIGSLIANQAGAAVELGEFMVARVAGDEEEQVQSQEDLEEIGYENSLIHQYQSKDMNPVTQFLFDLTVSVPTMAFVMAGGAALGLGAAKVAAAAGVGAVGTWLAGTLGFNAVEALVESGFNYIDIISDPMVVKKIEDTLGRKMTDEDKEDIRVQTLEVLKERADDSAMLVAAGNFFNPLNFGHTYGVGRLAKLIKVASGKWGTARRVGTRVAGREALEEALQSAGSQYTASEAKMLALQDVGAEMPFPLREGTIYGIDPQQVGYEALMGGVVGKVLGFGQGYLGHGKWEKGVYNLDKYGNPVRKGDPQKLDEAGEVITQPGDPNYVGKGLILHEVRKLIDIPSSEAALQKLDAYRQKAEKQGDGRIVRIIDEEIGYMKQGADLMGEKTDPKKTALRKDRATAFEPNAHNIVAEEVVEDAREVELERIRQEIHTEVDEPTTPQPLDLNEDPVLKANVNRIVKTPEDQRVPYDRAYLDLAKSNKELDNKQVNDVIKNMEKGGTLPKVAPTTVAEPLVIPTDTGTQAQPEAVVVPPIVPPSVAGTEQVGTVTDASVVAEVGATPEVKVETPEVKVETTEAPVVLNQSQSSKEIIQILKQWAGEDELIYSDKAQHGKNSSALKKYGEKNKLPFDKKNRYSFTPEQRVEVAASIAASQGITPSDTVILPTVPEKATAKQTTAEKATAKADAEAKVEAEAMSERAAEGAKADAAEAVPFTPALRYHEKIKLLDRDGKPIGYQTLEFLTQESKDLVQSLVGKTVLHYKQADGFRNEDPSSFPKKVVKWRFDGVDYDGNLIFTKANKGSWKAGQTTKDLKTIRDHALNKKGKHNWDAEQMFLHLLSGAGETYSNKAKGKDLKFKNGFLTEGVEASVPQRVSEGKERVPKELSQLDSLLRKYRGREEQVATDALTEGMVDNRQKSTVLQSPEVVTDKILAEEKAEAKRTKQEQMKDDLAAKREAKAAAQKAKAKPKTKEEVVVEPKVVEDEAITPAEEQAEANLLSDAEIKANYEAKVAETDVGTPTLTRTEVEGTIPETITDDVKEVWVDELMKKPRIKNLTLWDATDWKETNNHIGKELREDMATTGGTQDIVAVSKAPPELRKLIQRKLTAWLVATADPDTFDSVRVRYFPMLLDKQKSEVMSAVGRKTGVAPDTTPPKTDKFTAQEKAAAAKLKEGRPEKKELKKKPLVSDEVEAETVVTTEPTLTKDAVKATKKVPFKNSTTPDVWQVLTSEVQQILDLAGTSLSETEQKNIQTFIDSLGSDDAFIVSGGLSKGAEWKIYRLNTDIDIDKGDSVARYESGSAILTSLNPEGHPVPPLIKNVLQKHGRILSTDRKTNKLLSRKLDRTDLIEPPEGSPSPPSDILARVDRDVDVNLTELEATVNDMPIVWAFKTKAGKLVELQYMEASGKGLDPESVNVEFKDAATAARYVESIRSKAPKRKDLLQMDDELIEQFTSDNKKLSMHGEALIPTMTALVSKNASDYAELHGDEFQGSIEDYYKTSEPDGEVKVYTNEEIEAYEATLKDPNTHYSLTEDTVTISPEAKKPTAEDINDVIETFREQFGIESKIRIITEPSNPFYMDKRGIKGAYSPSEDTIYLVAGNLASKEDAAMTLLHEGIGHRSYKKADPQILNDEKRTELEELVKSSFPESYATEYEKQLGDIQGGKKNAIEGMTDAETAHTLAAQEVLAHKVERMTKEDFNPTVEENFSAWMRGLLRDFFKKMGFGEVQLTDNEVKILFNKLALDLSSKNKAGMSPYVGEATELPPDALYKEVPAHERFKNMGDIGIAQLEAMDRLFPDRSSRPDSTKSGWWSRFWAKAQWGVLDPYAVVKQEVGEVPYMKTRLANREDGVMATYLNHSLVKVKEVLIDGIKVKETHPDHTGKALWDTFRVFGNEDEVDLFIAWYGMHRADILEKEIGEETLGILRKDIDAILDPVTGNIAGTMKDATTGVVTSKKLIYEQAAKEVGAWNKSIVNLGIDLGLFNEESASNWNTEWYLPLFRYFEEDIGKDVPRGTRNYKSLAGQTGIKKLKGSKRPLDNMLDNLVRNALHIVSASLKNDAATLTLSEAEKVKDPITGKWLAERTKHPGPDSLRIIKDGKDVHYNINNELLFNTLGQMNVTNDFAGLGLAIGAKNLFTVITTANPLFKKRNLLKDTMNAAAQTEAGFNVFKNATGGWKEINNNKADLLVSGAYMQFGYLRSDDPNYAQKLLTKEMRAGFIGQNPRKHEGYMNAVKKAVALGRGVWDRYQNWGDKAENANRAWVYKTHLDKGDSQTKAAFEAKDVHDFTLHGGWRWVNLITSITPFANALLQGKYKMGRSLIKNPKPVVIVSTAITIASLAEYFMYEDNEEWQRRQDWDKDGFWWINIPGTDAHYRMPKPHELSIVANLTWRGVQMAKQKDPINGELFAGALKSVLSREFNMSLIPQVARPFVEVGFNENFFFDRPIEPYRFKNMTAKEKRDLYTSETMIRMSEGFDWAGVEVSPMQLSHIVNGYFGWVGEMAVHHADMIVSKDNDFPVRPASKIMEHPILRRTFQTSPIRNTKAGTRFYERMQDIEQAYNDLQLSKKLGDWDRYKEIYEEKKDLLKWRDFIKKKQRIFNELNKRIRVIRFDRTMSPENKRTRMDQLYALRNQIMDKIAGSPALR